MVEGEWMSMESSQVNDIRDTGKPGLLKYLTEERMDVQYLGSE